MPEIVCIEGSCKGQNFALKEKNVLGRSFDADIRIDDLSVSRHHAHITRAGDDYVVEDLGSGNGTFLNESRISEPARLNDGDTLRIAENVFRFSQGAAPEPGGDSALKIVEQPTGEQPFLETLDLKATLVSAATSGENIERDALVKAQQRLRMVLEISNAVQTQLDLDKLLDEIMARLFVVFPQADRGFILLKEDEGEKLVPRVARQRGTDRPEALTISKSIIQKALQNKVAVLSADAMTDQRFAMAMSVMSFHIRSMMCSPIIAEEDALGIIHLDTTRQDRRFTLDDLDLLAAVTNQMAFAISNARMHRKLLLQERTARDLQLARTVQQSFLPQKLPEVAGMQFCATYKAALEVGGDFYDFIELPDGRIGIVVGDVAGKGIPAALLMARMSSAAREFALTEPDPRQVVARLNDRLVSLNADGSFITLIYALLDLSTRKVCLVNAAHPAPVVFRGKTGEASEIAASENFPVGVAPGAEFEQVDFALEAGDRLCFYSDGITEAMNARQELYGSERLKAAAAKKADTTQNWMENMLKDVQSHVAGAYQSDDLTLVCIGAE